MLQAVRLGLIRLNEKIQLEGLNVYVAFKTENSWQKYCGDMARLKTV